MAKKITIPPEEVLKDLMFMLEQAFLIEHAQDYHEICRLQKKYGVSI